MAKKLTVVRAFCIDGSRQEVGTVVEVSDALAVELVSLGKASNEVSDTKKPKSKDAE
jgi:hypothetical protein